MRLVVIGTGYVGLVSGACLAQIGHDVVCVDQDAAKIATLASGGLPIFEPGLADVVAHARSAGRLSFSTNLSKSIRNADAVFVAVGTPPRPGDGQADLTQVHAVARELAAGLPQGAAVILKSTVPVGTGDEVERIIRARQPQHSVPVISNPEFLRQGAAVHDFLHPDRVVIGAPEGDARDVMADIYGPLGLAPAQLFFTSRRSAELIKYSANAFLATKIAFINEMSDLCERVGAEVRDVAKGIGLDPRVGPRFLEAGPGFGGSCFPKDTIALAKMGEDSHTSMRIVEAVIASNEQRKRAMARIVSDTLVAPKRGKTVAVLGLTFKAETDDMRASPAITLIEELMSEGIAVRAFDPAGMRQAQLVLPAGVTYCESLYDAAQGAHALAIVTEWKQFRSLDLERLKQTMAEPVMVDLRNIFAAQDMAAAGFRYVRIGGPSKREPARPVGATAQKAAAAHRPTVVTASDADRNADPRRRRTALARPLDA